MIKAIELKEWSDFVSPILADIYTAAANLLLIDSELESGSHVIKHPSFHNLWHQQRFILMVQLAKIFSNSSNQKRNFIKLCNRLESDTLDSDIEALLNANKPKLTHVFREKKDILSAIETFRENLSIHETSIKNLITLRDKVYAHSDPSIATGKPKITLEELRALTALAGEMYNTLFGKIFDRHLDFRTVDWDLTFIIRKLNSNVPPRSTNDNDGPNS